MATILKLGSLLMDGAHTEPGAAYQPGKTIRFVDGHSISWIVVNGMLIADHSLLVNISWDDLNCHGFVFGKRIIINGQNFQCRLLNVGEDRNCPNEWDAALDIVGEDNNLWYWHGVFFWGQETLDKDESSRAFRGYNSARLYNWDTSSRRNANFGFRPALVPLPSDHLSSGIEVCAKGGHCERR